MNKFRAMKLAYQFLISIEKDYTTMTNEKDGTFEDLLALTQVDLHPIVLRLHDLILSVYPDAFINTQLGYRATTFGVGPNVMKEGFVHILPHTKWVNLGFNQGAELVDPENLLEGTGAKMRHTKIRSIDECENPTVNILIRNALAERQIALGK